jgi:large subunit ribosomal protein L31
MKDGIHPEYTKCEVSCSGCGNSFETRSTMPEIKLAICGQCHPFYTGTQKLVDSAGRVDRFRKRYGMAKS